MNITDKLYLEWAWRSKTGTPDINNPDDKAILKQIYSELGLVLEQEKETVNDVTVDDLIALLDSKKASLDSKFIQSLYYTISDKGKKLGTYLSSVFSNKLLQGSANELFSIIQQYPGLERELKTFFDTPERQISISDIKGIHNIVDIAEQKTKLPRSFIASLIKAGKAAEGGKGVGEGEALLALLGREGKKLKIGDVQIEGKEIEVKGLKGRLIGRSESLDDLYTALSSLGIEPRKVGKGPEAAHTYISNVATSFKGSEKYREVESTIKDLLAKEFNLKGGIDITSSEDIKKGMLEWYVDFFFNNEASNVDYIAIIIGETSGVYTKQEFKQGVLDGNIVIQNFTRTNKSPQILSFKSGD